MALMTLRETIVVKDKPQRPSISAATLPAKELIGAGKLEEEAPDPWQEAQERVLHYLKLLGLPPFQCLQTAQEALQAAIKISHENALAHPTTLAMRALNKILTRDQQILERVACKDYPILHQRWRQPTHAGACPAPAPSDRPDQPAATPPINRGRMPIKRIQYASLVSLARGLLPRRPNSGLRRAAALADTRRAGPAPTTPRLAGTSPNKDFNHNNTWERTATARRILLVVLILSTTAVASGYMANILPHQGRSGLELVLVIFFGLLFAWISIGFWTALLGFTVLWRRFDRFAITRTLDDRQPAAGAQPRTAILIPVYNESVDRVFAGIRATYRSLVSTGRVEDFDFFVLSDSTEPDTLVQEELAWARFCREFNAWGRFFYRHRRPNTKRKSGNIADFCRRWGRNYRYMAVFDADSVMAGSTLLRMVQLMERNPRVGILQTVPMAVGRKSLIARVQQFANHVYGPMFAAGLHFWQLGDAQYWGHNAIIRTAPFMAHCGLPQLSGNPPLGGTILSHDFVEAALMRGAGWGVWLAYDLECSWEEPPATLIDELARDRRWCQGNIQHLRLLLSRRILPAHRALFLNGAMSYVSALLWFLFLSISSAEAISQGLYEPNYFPSEGGLFPDWPVWNLGWAITLLVSTVIILLLPKLFSLVLIVVKQKQAWRYGGGLRLAMSVLAEVVVSMLLAPLRMLAHSKFVIITLLGRNVQWNPLPRDDNNTGWKEAFRFHGPGMLYALVWGGVVFMINPPFFWWLTPILTPLVLAVPISVWSSRATLGGRLHRWGLFLTPEEVSPSRELALLEASLQGAQKPGWPAHMGGKTGFVQAVVNPLVNGLHRAFRRDQRKISAPIADRRQRLIEKALANGPESLHRAAKMELLSDPASISELHQRVWELPGGAEARRWGLGP